MPKDEASSKPGLIMAARIAAEVGMTTHRAATPLATEAAASGTAAPAPEAGFRRQPGLTRSLPKGPIQRPDLASPDRPTPPAWPVPLAF
jgi:hypothetical protein